MKTLKIKDFIRNAKVKVKTPKSFPSSPDMYALPILGSFCAKRGSGKTNAVTLLVQRMKSEYPATRVFIMSPTVHSPINVVLKTLNPDPEDIYDDLDTVNEDLIDIQNKAKQEKEDLFTYYKQKAIWDAYEKMGVMADLEELPEEFLLELEDMGYQKPTHRWNGKKVHSVLICDDLSHSALYSKGRSNVFNNMALRHRHIGFGISIILCVQSFLTGVPKVIRQNLTNLFLWHTHDTTQLESIYKEIGNSVPKDRFYEIYNQATTNPHDFLSLDLNKKKNHISQFRKNFDEYILPK